MKESKILCIPAAGSSTRFPGLRPKWLLTLDDGKLMIEHALACMLKSNSFDRIIVTCLNNHLIEFADRRALNDALNESAGQIVELHAINESTKSQAETVAKTIIEKKISGPILIKDCDNQFDFKWSVNNEVAVLRNSIKGIRDVSSKSYVVTDKLNIIQNIAEKQIISDRFCCGAYGFDSAKKFVETFEKLPTEFEIYISHIIYKRLLEGTVYTANEATNYADWGTIQAYHQYMEGGLTIFCDVDGVLLDNGSRFGFHGWRTPPIESNTKALKSLIDKLRVYLIITTSRPESEKEYIKEKLGSYGIVAQAYLMGLPHSKRVLINDYSLSNPYPTAISINIERNTDSLELILQSFGLNQES